MGFEIPFQWNFTQLGGQLTTDTPAPNQSRSRRPRSCACRRPEAGSPTRSLQWTTRSHRNGKLVKKGLLRTRSKRDIELAPFPDSAVRYGGSALAIVHTEAHTVSAHHLRYCMLAMRPFRIFRADSEI